jgi:hypothetical protein
MNASNPVGLTVSTKRPLRTTFRDAGKSNPGAGLRSRRDRSRMGASETGTGAGREIRVPDGLFRKSEEQEVAQRTTQQEKCRHAQEPRARGERLCIPPRRRIAVAEQSSRTATCANANATQNAGGSRTAFVTAHLRNAARRVRGGCVHYNATNGAFDGNGFSAVRPSVTGSA